MEDEQKAVRLKRLKEERERLQFQIDEWHGTESALLSAGKVRDANAQRSEIQNAKATRDQLDREISQLTEE